RKPVATALCAVCPAASKNRERPAGAWLQLINKRHQPFGAPHVIGVLRAKRGRQGILLHIHAMNESRANRQKYDKQRGPVAQRQGFANKRPAATVTIITTHTTSNVLRSCFMPVRLRERRVTVSSNSEIR